MADVWQWIRDAKVLIGVLTGKNPNVFYELGLAHAIGKPVILLSETLDDVPFDLQALRILLYNKDDPSWGLKLRKSISAALDETLAEPVQAVPSMFRKKVKSQAPEESELAARVGAIERKLASPPASRNRLPERPLYDAAMLQLLNQLKRARSRKEAVRMVSDSVASASDSDALYEVLADAFGNDEALEILSSI